MIGFEQRQRLLQAEQHAAENGLAAPYTGTVIKEQLNNQRALLQLEDGSILMANQGTFLGDPEIDSATGKLLQPTIHLDGKELRVIKISHRPNHDAKHSTRAAYLVPVLIEYFKHHGNDEYKEFAEKADEQVIERLQHMLMFSVIGREDETGFNAGHKGRKAYEGYRNTSARKFLEYCQEHCLGPGKLYATEAEILQDALIVELMGYPTMPDDVAKEKPNSYVLGLMKKHIPPLDCPKSGFHPLLDMMNRAHGLELFRCYPPYECSTVLWGILYKSGWRAHDNVKPTLRAFLELVHYSARLIEATGDKFTTQVKTLSDEDIDALLIELEVICQTHTGSEADLTHKLNEKITEAIFVRGSGQYKTQFFEFCNYLPLETQEQADLNLRKRDHAKDAEVLFNAIEAVKTPDFMPVHTISNSLPKIKDVDENEDRIVCIFENKDYANNFCEVLAERSLIEQDFQQKIQDAKVKLLPAEYHRILQYLKFEVVRIPKVRSTENTFVNDSGEYEVMNAIRDCKALVHTFGSTKVSMPSFDDPTNTVEVDDFRYWLDKIENPVYSRRSGYHEKPKERRDIYVSPRKQLKIIRTQRLTVTPEKQAPRTSPRSLTRYYKPGSNLLAPLSYHEQQNRGKPVNTKYTPKTAHSLLRPDGRMIAFQGQPQVQQDFYPIGTLSHADKVDLKGERYIWDGNVRSFSKFWLGTDATNTYTFNILNRRKAYSFKDLQQRLTTQARNAEAVSTWTELLISTTKDAIDAVYTQEDNLFYRLNLLSQADRMKREYGYDIPMLIIDGNQPVKIYCEQAIRNDLEMLIDAYKTDKLKQGGQFEYIKTLQDRLTGQPINKNVDKQQEILTTFITTHLNEDDLKLSKDEIVEILMGKLNIIGTKARMRNDIRMATKDEKKDQLQKLFAQCIRLNFTDIALEMMQKGSVEIQPLNPQGDYPIHLAIKNKNFNKDFISKLLDDPESQSRVNKDGQTPLQVVLMAANADNCRWFFEELASKNKMSVEDLLKGEKLKTIIACLSKNPHADTIAHVLTTLQVTSTPLLEQLNASDETNPEYSVFTSALDNQNMAFIKAIFSGQYLSDDAKAKLKQDILCIIEGKSIFAELFQIEKIDTIRYLLEDASLSFDFSAFIGTLEIFIQNQHDAKYQSMLTFLIKDALISTDEWKISTLIKHLGRRGLIEYILFDYADTIAPDLDTLIDKIPDFDLPDPNNQDEAVKLLFKAAELGNHAALDYLVQKGVNIDAGRDYHNALYLAAKEGNEDTVRKILNMGIKPEYIGSAFTAAADNGHANVVEAFLQSDHEVSETGKVLFKVFRQSQWDMLEVLVQNGYDLNTPIKSFHTCLNWACFRNSPRLVKAALKHGATIRFTHNDNETSCFFKVKTHHEFAKETLKILIEHGGADEINFFDRKKSQTPFTKALCEGNLEIIDLYLESGADVTLAVHGKTPINVVLSDTDNFLFNQGILTSMTQSADSKVRERAAQLHEILTSGENISDKMKAEIQAHQDKILDKLLEAGADLNEALTYEVEQGNAENILRLIQLGANPNATRNGVPLINIALEKKLDDSVTSLLKAGAISPKRPSQNEQLDYSNKIKAIDDTVKTKVHMNVMRISVNKRTENIHAIHNLLIAPEIFDEEGAPPEIISKIADILESLEGDDEKAITEAIIKLKEEVEKDVSKYNNQNIISLINTLKSKANNDFDKIRETLAANELFNPHLCSKKDFKIG